VISLLITLLVGLAPSQATPPSSLVGLWELSRWDNVPRPEAPPYGLFNLQVVFSRDGTLRFVTPHDQEPAEGEYKVQGQTFKGWLGLTNDLSGRADLAWATRERFELTYPDGSVATFVRLSPEAVLPPKPLFRCVPVTVRGVDYLPEHVALAKRLLDRKAAEERLPEDLIGTWLKEGEHDGVRTSIWLTFGADGVVDRCTVVKGKYSPPSARRTKDSYSVREGHLLSGLFACGDPIKFQIKDKTLTLGSEGESVLHREASERDVDDCK
jgi:hypothetical protein